MTKIKDYIQLHLNILLFSLTSVFSKLASVYYNKEGLHSPLLYVFLFLMIANCGIYAIAWQQVIKNFSSTAYANKVSIFCVPGMGCDHFSRKSFASEHHRHPDRSDRSLDGAEI